MRVIQGCPNCKKPVTRRGEDAGYVSGSDLGRPAGAKGKDLFVVYWVCPDHGEVDPISVEIAEWWDSAIGSEITLPWPEGDYSHIPANIPRQDVVTIGARGEVFDAYGNIVDDLPSTDPGCSVENYLRGLRGLSRLEEAVESPAIVLLNEQHSLLPAQTDLLDGLGRPWVIRAVPATGWTAEEIRAQAEELSGCALVIFASPVPLLIKLVAAAGTPTLVFHNDRRVAKEVPDGKGGVKVIHAVAPDGWELL